MEFEQLQRAIEAILFAAGERVEASRLAMALETDVKDISAAADALADEMAFARRGIRILKLEKGTIQAENCPEVGCKFTVILETE